MLGQMFTGLAILFAVALGVLLAAQTAGVVHSILHPRRLTDGVALARGWAADPDQAGATWRAERVVGHDAEPVELWRITGKSTSDGPIVVMVHGWGDSRIAELQWLDVLSEAAAQLVMFDLPGHGDSPRPRCTWGVVEVDLIRTVVRHVANDGRPVVLHGASMGAALAIEAASERGLNVSAVIADSPYRRPTTAIAGTMRDQGLPGWPSANLAWAAMGLGWPGRWRADTARFACHVTAPLLLLHGEADTVSPLRDSQDVADAAPHARLVTFSRMGHTRAWCDQPEAYRRAIADFLHRHNLRGEPTPSPVTSAS